MPADANDSFRIRKFLARADLVLQGPVYELRAMDAAGFAIKGIIQVDRTTGTSRLRDLDLGVGDLTRDTLEANAARCRVFLLEGEDVNVVQIVGILRRWVHDERRSELAPLAAMVRGRIKDGRLIGAHFYGARMNPGEGIEDGPLLGNDQVAMDFIYGHLVHQDRDAAERLRRVGSDAWLTLAVASKLNDLMQVVYWTRFEINRAMGDGALVLT